MRRRSSCAPAISIGHPSPTGDEKGGTDMMKGSSSLPAQANPGWLVRNVLPFSQILLIITFACGLLILMGGNSGKPVPSPDSSYYVSMAHGLVEGEGFPGYFTSWSSPPESMPGQVTHFPPGYPLLLASMAVLGIDPRGHGLLVANTGLLLISLLALGLIIWRLTKSWAWASLGVLASLSGRLMSSLYLRVWSEPLFVALLLLGTLLLVEYWDSGRRIWLVLSGMSLGLMWLTRYAGIALIPTAVLYLAIRQRVVHPRNSGWVWVFAVLAAIPMMTWLTRNELVAHTIASGHAFAWEPTPWPIYTSLSASFGGPFGVMGFMLVVISLLGFGGWRWLNTNRAYIWEHEWPPVLRATVVSPISLIVMMAVGYGLFVVVGGSVVNFDVNQRMLAPGYPLLIALLVVCTQRLFEDSTSTWIRSSTLGAVNVGLLFICFPMRRTLPIPLTALVAVCFAVGWFIVRRRSEMSGKGMILASEVIGGLLLTFFLASHLVMWAQTGERSLRREGTFVADSPLFSWISENIHGAVVYSNEWERIYYNFPDLDRAKVRDLPREDLGESLQRFYQRIGETGGYIIFTEYRHRTNLYSEAQLTDSGEVDALAEFDDGRVYAIVPR